MSHLTLKKEGNVLRFMGLSILAISILAFACSDDKTTNPTGPDNGSYHVLRGGSWFSNAKEIRAASRFYAKNDPLREDDLGFRLVAPQMTFRFE